MHIEYFSPGTLTLATLNKSISEHGPFILQALACFPSVQPETALAHEGLSIQGSPAL